MASYLGTYPYIADIFRHPYYPFAKHGNEPFPGGCSAPSCLGLSPIFPCFCWCQWVGFPGKIRTGKPHFFMGTSMVSCIDFPLNQSIHGDFQAIKAGTSYKPGTSTARGTGAVSGEGAAVSERGKFFPMETRD